MTLVLMCLGIFSCSNDHGSAQELEQLPCSPLPPPVYPETYRPRFHVTPEENWMNDPNGLVFHKGEYHLFFQHQPAVPFFCTMYWGHAVSRDLVHWQHLPVALTPDPLLGQVYSGSAVVDHNNTSGLCHGPAPDEQACMVALFTHHGGKDHSEKQSLAFSNDAGRTLMPYTGNPVLPNPGLRDFRDPKVFWHEPTQRWIMVLAARDRVRFFGSNDLILWDYLSEFGPAGTIPGVWECPDLFELSVNGIPEETRWVLEVDYNQGILIGESGGQYFVGDFDGTRFTTEQAVSRRVDFGADFYASQSWSDAPDGRRIWIAWMNNWQYALFLPTSPWRGAMTVPRDVHLVSRGNSIVLAQQPAAELEALRHCRIFSTRERLIQGESDLLATVTGETLELVATVQVNRADRFGLRLRVDEDTNQATVVGYDAFEKTLFIDRSRSGKIFSTSFSPRQSAPLHPEGDFIDLRILVDSSSVEVFADNGTVVLTDLIFPDPGSQGLQIYTEGGPAIVRSLDVFLLKSIW